MHSVIYWVRRFDGVFNVICTYDIGAYEPVAAAVSVAIDNRRTYLHWCSAQLTVLRLFKVGVVATDRNWISAVCNQ